MYVLLSSTPFLIHLGMLSGIDDRLVFANAISLSCSYSGCYRDNFLTCKPLMLVFLRLGLCSNMVEELGLRRN